MITFKRLLRIAVFFLVAALCARPDAQAQDYFIKRETPKAATAPAKRELFVRRPSDRSQNQTGETDENPDSFLSRSFSQPEDDSRPLTEEELKTLISESIGECTEDDKMIIRLVSQGWEQYNRELGAFVEKGTRQGEYDWLEDFDIEAARVKYEKTGKLPEEYKHLIEKSPEKALGIAKAITQQDNMELYAMASMRCASDMEGIEEMYLKNTPATTTTGR